MGDVKNVKNLTKRQRLFVEWLATSKYDRIPPTQRLLADELGINEATLSRWKKLPGFMDLVVATARGYIHDRLPEVYAALAREAEGGSFQHIKLMLELSGEYQETRGLDVTTKGESLNERRHAEQDRVEALASIADALGAGL